MPETYIYRYVPYVSFVIIYIHEEDRKILKDLSFHIQSGSIASWSRKETISDIDS